MGVQIQMNTTTITHLLQLVSNLSNWRLYSTNTNGTVIGGFYSGTYTNVVTVGNVITTQPANKVIAGGNTVFFL
jgi:hypothetical protein